MKTKKVNIYPREGAASVISQLRILEPAILALDKGISIAAFDWRYVSVCLPLDNYETLKRKIQTLVDTHVSA